MRRIFLLMSIVAIAICSNGQSLSYREFIASSNTQKSVTEKKKKTYTTNFNTSFVADVAVQGLFGWEEYDWNYYMTTATPSIAANVGVELLMFYLGIGIEFMPCFSPNNSYYRYYDSQASKTFRNFSIPLYFTWRTYIRSSETFQPYFWCDLGGMIGANYGKDGVLLRAGFAVDYKRINIGIFGHMSALGKNTDMMLGFGAKVGYRFGNLTY